MEEGQGPFPSWEGKRSVGISQRQKERSTLEEGLTMGKWSIRKRKGFDTPSLEEFLWYHFLPGGVYKTAKSGSTESEEFDYYVLSGLGWFGSMAYAMDAMAAAQSLGTTNIAAEFAVARNISYIRTAGIAARHIPMLAAPLTAAYVGQEVGSALFHEAAYTAGADVPASSTKPWFIPLPFWLMMH